MTRSKTKEPEAELVATVLSGRAIAADLQEDAALVRWAEREGRLVRVDRRPWRNPLRSPRDGTPAEVAAWYRESYLPFKPNLLELLPRLRGKVLAYEGPCAGAHATVLAEAASRDA